MYRKRQAMLSGAAILLIVAASTFADTPLGTSFTYQGRLAQNGAVFNGDANMVFLLHDSEAGADPPIAANGALVPVVDGVFAVDLDFGPDAFNGDGRWLEIRVDGTTLSPRQPLNATPYALQTRGIVVDGAGNVGIGTASPATELDIDGTVTATAFVGDGAGLTNLPVMEGVWTENGADISYDAGNVGIGTTTPATTLDVDGTVTATAFVGDGSGLTGLPEAGESTNVITAWGTDTFGLMSDAPAGGEYVALASGWGHVVAIAPDGALVSWGDDDDDQISDTPTTGTYVAVAAGGSHSVAIASDGTLVSWGDDFAGQVGDTPTTGTYVAVDADLAHNVAIAADGSLVSWGSDISGQISGTPTTGTYVAAAAGANHSVAIAADGTLVSWGSDSSGLVSGTPTTGTYIAVGAGEAHSVALRDDGTLVSWGGDSLGQVSQTPTSGTYVAVAAGRNHSVAIASDGAMVSWGADFQGQVSQTPAAGTYVAVSAGSNHSVALQEVASLDFVALDGISSDLLVSGNLIAARQVGIGQDLTVDGRVGIGTDIPGAPLTVVGTIRATRAVDELESIELSHNGNHANLNWTGDGRLRIRYDDSNLVQINQTGLVGIGRNPSTNVLEVEGDASKSTAGDWLANSDRRIKTDIQTIDNALETLDRVRLVSFEYTEDYQAAHPGVGDGRYLNVIAQEFAQVFPDHVKNSGEKLPDGSEILQVDTYPLTIYSAAAIQELRAHTDQRLAEKDAEIASLRARLARLEALIEHLTTR